MWTQAQVVAAFVTGIVSLTIALWNYFSGRKTQIEIEILKNKHTSEQSENDARRSYEFDARKRLYEEYEPLLFQLMEASDNAIHRVQSLARTAKHGNLNDDGWLSDFNYYPKSTIYKLLVPIALYRIMQKKLTLVDITVDKSIGLRYNLAKMLYISYTDDFEFARLYRNIEYDPNHDSWLNLRKENPVKYWRQGLPMGLLDKTVDLLIEKENNEKERIISYGEFEKKIFNQNAPDINLSRDIFFNFHPQKRPVLWRILIAQSIILRTLIELKDYKPEQINNFLVKSLLLQQTNIEEFQWTTDPEILKEVQEPFLVAIEYFTKRF